MTLQRINCGRGHFYKLDGQKADGVTTLIGDALRKKALEAWGIRATAEYVADHLEEVYAMRGMGREAVVSALKQAPYTDRDAAAKRGTEVHGLGERLAAGEQVDLPDELAGHVESYVRFLDEWQPTPVLLETVVASRTWRYMGTLDAVFDLPDGRRVIVDLKTTRSGIFGETALQVAAYRYAEIYLDADGNEQPMADLGITDAMGVWVRSDGYDVVPLDAGPDTFKTFQHVAFVARRARGLRDLVGDALPTPIYQEIPG